MKKTYHIEFSGRPNFALGFTHAQPMAVVEAETYEEAVVEVYKKGFECVRVKNWWTDCGEGYKPRTVAEIAADLPWPLPIKEIV